jgi:hypothetical protein
LWRGKSNGKFNGFNGDKRDKGGMRRDGLLFECKDKILRFFAFFPEWPRG